ncbi:histone-lysine N-methyltransferase SETD2 isoform X2 [Triticum aestivum]|uniref:histone-lysine N-methyltransferase SETD2 isoform X2 n=1 Tax=Triticum aestivum TaxID=4565 RepID=UPI001D023A75|nr:histone-lysine N-methyltransferase SETD2-like isoform X2 [Triticum aestivum]
MHEYTSDAKDPQRFNEIEMTDDEVTECVKKMLDEPIAACSQTGLLPFYASNKPSAAKDSFWKRKTQDKPARAPRAKSKVTKKPAKRKTAESADPPEDIEESDQEDDAEASRTDHVEVISLSSSSDHMLVQKFRRAVRKVKRSHPLAHLDPQFSLKTQQHEGRRTTRHSGQQVTSSGLPDTPPRKRRPEVTSISSSGDSSTTQLPPLKTVAGAKARLSKKAKTSGPTDEAEPEKTPEDTGRDIEVVMDDSAPQDPATDANPPEAGPATHVDPSSPHATPPSPAADPPSPARDTVNPPSSSKGGDDVIITGTGHTSPGNPVVLAKHTAKEEFVAMGKGKEKTDLSSYVNFTAEELHSSFLHRLYTSRDYEAGLVNMMKERYEANINNKDSKIADLQENIKSQQSETSKAKDELKNALTAMEQLKEGFKNERASWETEKTALLKWAEDAESALKPVKEELTGLKRQVNAMTSAIL